MGQPIPIPPPPNDRVDALAGVLAAVNCPGCGAVLRDGDECAYCSRPFIRVKAPRGFTGQKEPDDLKEHWNGLYKGTANARRTAIVPGTNSTGPK